MDFITYLQENQGFNRSFGIFDGQLNLPFKIYSPEGYDTLFPKAYGQLLELETSGRVSGAAIPKNSPQTMPLLNLLGVKYAIQGTVHGAAPWELQLWNYPDQFTMDYEDTRYQVHSNHLAQSRTFKTYTPQKTVIEVDFPKSQPLVLADNAYPGWKATIDNQPTSILTTDTSLRSVNVPTGRHLVEFIYQPPSFTLGLSVSIISLIGLKLWSRKLV